MIPEGLKYTESHEWIRVDDDLVVIGITDHAQHELGDIVFVELPPPDTDIAKGDSFGTIESVKAASDIYSPVSGTVVEVNEELENAPETVNQNPYEDGWFIKIRITDPAELEELMDATTYSETLND